MCCRLPRTLLLLLVCAVLPVPGAAQAETAGQAFTKLQDDSWEWALRQFPQFATQAGDHRYDDQLGEVSLAAERDRLEARRGFLARLEAIDRAALTPDEQVNYDIFARQLGDDIRGAEFRTYLTPISDRWGFHVEFPEMRRNVPLATVKEYENYIARLRDFADHADGHIELMRAGIEAGVTLPAVIMQRYAEPIEAQIVDDPTESLLYEPLREFPSAVPESEHDRLRAEARTAIAESVVPGYRRFLAFMRDEYVPHCRQTIAASDLPDGREFYRWCVRRYTTVDDLSPEGIHAIGLAEVARIRAEMDDVIREVGFEGDFAEFAEFLRTDPRFYAETPEELIKETSLILKHVDGQLPKLFGQLPRMPYGVRQVPAYIAPQSTAAYYQLPTGDGRQAGFFYVNTYNLPSRPLYMLEALSLHEAVPGHHLQLALQQELDDLPKFRQYASFTGYVEGWALYAERLGLEAGCYQDPYSNFGRLTMEIWRANRLVVDTGIHYLGWTRQQAIDFMSENSAAPLHDIRSEVDRYIGWPGQALAYKIGELKIRELRAEAEERLGERFDLRAFHDVVLDSGAVPLDVLENNVHAWIDEQDTVQ